MKIVGLTGGIGSGKTTVAAIFAGYGIPIYIADIEAKKLTNTSKIIQRKVSQLLGSRAYKDGILDSAYVSRKVFEDDKLLQQLNAIIHPKVKQHFARWVKKQEAPYVIKEAAILFETGGDKDCDATILVTAPEEIRIKRVLKRSPHETIASIKKRIKNQWSDAEKIPKATFLLENISKEETVKKVAIIHQALLNN